MHAHAACISPGTLSKPALTLHACWPARSVKVMYTHRNPKNDDEAPLVADDVYKIIMEVSRISSCPRVASILP